MTTKKCDQGQGTRYVSGEVKRSRKQPSLEMLFRALLIAVVSFVAIQPALAGDLSPEMMGLLGQFAKKYKYSGSEMAEKQMCIPDAQARVANIIRHQMMMFAFNKVVVEPLQKGASDLVEVAFPEAATIGYAKDTYGIYKCFLDSSGKLEFAQCLENLGFDKLAGKVTDKLAEGAATKITDKLVQDKEMAKDKIKDNLDRAYTKFKTLAKGYQSKKEVWDVSGKMCKQSSIHAEWRKKPRIGGGGRGGLLIISITFSGCTCGTNTTAQNGSYFAKIPVKYVKHKGRKPGFELNLAGHFFQHLFAKCCGGNTVRRGFCEDIKPTYMSRTACRNTCAKPGQCHQTGLYAGLLGTNDSSGQACYVCRLPPTPTLPSPPLPHEPAPRSPVSVQQPEPTCPICQGIANNIKALVDNLSIIQKKLQNKQAKMASMRADVDDLNKYIRQLEALLVKQVKLLKEARGATMGTGASAYDPGSDSTTTAVDMANGIVKITIREGKGKGGRVLGEYTRQNNHDKVIKEINATISKLEKQNTESKAKVKQLQRDINTLKRKMKPLQKAIADLKNKLKKMLKNLSECMVLYCHGQDADIVGIELEQIIAITGNNPGNSTDPLMGGDTTGTSGGFDFNLITTPPRFFGTAGATGGFVSCGVETTNISFATSTLTLDPFYANPAKQTFAVSGNVAISTNTNLTILGLPGHTCTVTPSDANTFVVKCANNSTGGMCSDTWRRK